MHNPVRIINRSGTNEILLYGEIYYGAERDFIEVLRGIAPGPLVVRISSEGGDFFSGLAVFTALKRRGNISVFIDSMAASAASVVAMAADAGKLVIAPEAFVFLHRAHSSVQGEAKDF
ncbi:MAG: ATP-dependent Clp protease proteolytic subunit, partial [Rhodospirillales bacterium]|nr:ATP-dependent Clp protease proteolytic subunit [Rhodospirillales bacterium]